MRKTRWRPRVVASARVVAVAGEEMALTEAAAATGVAIAAVGTGAMIAPATVAAEIATGAAIAAAETVTATAATGAAIVVVVEEVGAEAKAEDIATRLYSRKVTE